MPKMKGYIICHVCLQEIMVTSKGAVFSHYGQFNGTHFPLCTNSGRQVKNPPSRDVRKERAEYSAYA
jgi:hypothetical protein